MWLQRYNPLENMTSMNIFILNNKCQNVSNEIVKTQSEENNVFLSIFNILSDKNKSVYKEF